MQRIFAPYPQALHNTLLAIAERCRFQLDNLAGKFPLFPIPPEESSTHSYLRTLVMAGARKRYGQPLTRMWLTRILVPFASLFRRLPRAQ